MGAVPLVRVVRSGLEESLHLGHVAICDAEGRLVASAGDPRSELFARSCMKPLQAAVSLHAIGDVEVPDREVAVMCASHNGEPVHVGAVQALLARAGLDPSALRNPPGWPLDEGSMARAQHQHRILQNCSGKHAGMLFASQRSGWDLGSYLRAGHPLQRRVHRAVLRAAGLEKVRVGVDGCGVPVHGMPLSAMAVLFARMTRPEFLGDMAPAVDRALEAMLVEPYLVGGRGRLDTAVIETTGDVVAKSGAEALVCAAVLPSGLGVAVKVADGGWRAGPPALLRALALVDGVGAEQLERLSRHARPWVMGGGARVGEMVADFDLTPARRSR
jgi:L-asparaginase II